MKAKRLAVLLICSLFLISCGTKKSTNGDGDGTAPKISNKDIVEANGRLENIERLDSFVKNVNQKMKDKVRLVRYTIEGDPIFHTLDYDGSKLSLTLDTTEDKFGQGEVKTYDCTSIKKEETNVQTQYFLEGCPNKEIGELLKIAYDVDKEDLFAFQLKYGEGNETEINTRELKLIIKRSNGDNTEVSDFQFSKEEINKIYKLMVFANYLEEKKLSTKCEKESNEPYELNVWINGATRHYEWRDCDQSRDGKVMTKLAQDILQVLKGNSNYKRIE